MARKSSMGTLSALLFVSAGTIATAQDELTPPPPPPEEAQQPTPATGQPQPSQPIPAPPPGYGGQQSPYVQAQPQAPIRPALPLDPTPQRSGFTFEAGLGISLMQSDETDGDVGFGIAPLSLGVGFFLSEDLALSIRATGASFFQDFGDTIGVFVLQHYGANVQFFIDDRFMVAGGPALSVIGALDGGDLDLGFGVNARAGYALLSSRRINIRVLLELLMGAGHNEGAIFGQCLKVEFQLL